MSNREVGPWSVSMLEGRTFVRSAGLKLEAIR